MSAFSDAANQALADDMRMVYALLKIQRRALRDMPSQMREDAWAFTQDQYDEILRPNDGTLWGLAELYRTMPTAEVLRFGAQRAIEPTLLHDYVFRSPDAMNGLPAQFGEFARAVGCRTLAELHFVGTRPQSAVSMLTTDFSTRMSFIHDAGIELIANESRTAYKLHLEIYGEVSAVLDGLV